MNLNKLSVTQQLRSVESSYSHVFSRSSEQCASVCVPITDGTPPVTAARVRHRSPPRGPADRQLDTRGSVRPRTICRRALPAQTQVLDLHQLPARRTRPPAGYFRQPFTNATQIRSHSTRRLLHSCGDPTQLRANDTQHAPHSPLTD